MDEVPQTLELRNRAYVLGPQAKKIGWIVVALIGVAAGVAAALLARWWSEPGAGDAARQLVDKRGVGVWHMLALAAATVLVAIEFGYFWLASRGERLFLDAAGMRLQSPLPRLLRFLYPGWSLKWDEVRRARLERLSWMPGPAAAVLVLTAHSGERRVRPYAWVDAKSEIHETPAQGLRRLQRMSKAELTEAVTESALMRYVKARLPQLDPGAAQFSVDRAFALERNPRALIAVAALFVLIVYALADALLNTETYAGAPPFAVFVGAGSLAAAAAFAWLLRSAVPMAESAGVALLLGCAVGVALYPGLLRINQLTDARGLEAHRYVLQRDYTLAPQRPGPPVLAFPGIPDYWLQFEAGSTHELLLRQGGLGFYQIDMAPVYARTRAFYRGRR